MAPARADRISARLWGFQDELEAGMGKCSDAIIRFIFNRVDFEIWDHHWGRIGKSSNITDLCQNKING